jgi:tetratricopeptide (TPR) repeat protein
MERLHIKIRYFLIIQVIEITVFIIIALTFGLFKYLTPFGNVLVGNYYYSRGEYGQAINNYFKAAEKKQWGSFISYNLGNVYAALGETEPARDILKKALNTKEHDLLFCAHFNLGNLFYEAGQYEQAINNYIEALKANHNSVEAKINLEFALKKSLTQTEKEYKESSIPKSQINEQSQQILDLIKKEETKIWQSQRETTPKEVELQNDW